MTNLQKINKTFQKFGYDYNPKFMWWNLSFSVKPMSTEEYIPMLSRKITDLESANVKRPEVVKKYKDAYAALVLADPKSQALNADFDPNRKETHPDQFWAYFNSL